MAQAESDAAEGRELGRIEGVAVGLVLGFEDGAPIVVFSGNLSEVAVKARSTVTLTSRDVGAEVALAFEDGDPARPIVIGRIHRPDVAMDLPPEATPPPTLTVDSTPVPLEITAERELTLRCGKASITLTREGKIILRGTYISSRSTGANRIKGGSVQIN